MSNTPSAPPSYSLVSTSLLVNSVIFFSLATVAVALRVHARRITSLELRSDDWSIIFSLVRSWRFLEFSDRMLKSEVHEFGVLRQSMGDSCYWRHQHNTTESREGCRSLFSCERDSRHAPAAFLARSSSMITHNI